jgi:hypothetical protein
MRTIMPPPVSPRSERVGEIQQPVVGELRVQGDVHETAIAVGPRARHSGNRSRIEHAVAHHAEATLPLGDQQATIGQKGQGARRNERRDWQSSESPEHPFSRTPFVTKVGSIQGRAPAEGSPQLSSACRQAQSHAAE